MRYRVAIDATLCEGHGLCAVAAPQVFAIGDDGKGVVTDPIPDEALRPLVVEASQRCPAMAITLDRL